MKAVAKKGGPPAARARKAAESRRDLFARFGVSRRQVTLAGIALGALLFVGAGYLVWDAIANREVDYASTLKAGPAYEMYRVGVTAGQARRYGEAEQAFQRAIEADPTNALPYNALATIYVHQQEFQKALVTCENGIYKAPGSADLYYTLGLVRFHLQKYDDARQALERALELRGAFADARLWLGNTYLVASRVSSEDGGAFDQARLADAVEQFRLAVALAPDTPQYRAALGEAYYNQRELDAALAEYEKAAELDPESGAYRVAAGKIYDQLGDLDDAESAFKKAVDVDRTNAEAHYGLGLVYFKRGGQDDQAMEAFRKTIAINEYHADAHEKLGQALVRAGLQEEGEAEAALAEESRRRAAVLDQFRQLAAQQPTNADVANKLGIELARQGKYEEAFVAFQRVLALNPRHVDARYQLAGVYFQKGSILEAMTTFEEVDRIEPGYRETNRWLATLYGKVGRKTQAERREQMWQEQIAVGARSESQ